MKSKRMLTATVAAITLLVGTLGTALWPSPAGAVYPIRKFTGAISGGSVTVWVHNPHPTSTFKAEVVTRAGNGVEIGKVPLTIPPNVTKVTSPPWCALQVCSLEVNMNNVLLQPSAAFSGVNGSPQYVFSGDFSR